MTYRVERDEVVASRDLLPAFPRVVEEVLATLDDPDLNLKLLVGYVGRDPVLTARVFSQANAAANRVRPDSTVRDLYAATSLIGLARLRQTTIMTCLAGFLRGALPAGMLPGFWQHSAAAGICAQQLAAHLHLPGEAALIAGLLHDIGQLWLSRFAPADFAAAWQAAAARRATIDDAERERFGVDHATIGAWLAEGWGLPPAIGQAIRYHHAADDAPADLLVYLVHVAEVLSNALDVSGSESVRVSFLSGKACEALGLSWDESANALFGRIDAAGRFASTFFLPPAA